MRGVILFICLIGLLEAHEHHHEEFEWTAEKTEFADIQVEVAGPGKIQKYTQVSGRIIAHPDHLAYVIPKAEGIVSTIQKNLGDRVKKGEVLAVVESQEVAEAKTHYLLAMKRTLILNEFLKREEALRGISKEQDYLEAKLAADEAAIESECALQHLYTLGFSEQEIGQLQEENPAQRRFYQIKAPLNGKILERQLTLGERVNEETLAFTVGNFEKVWVEMHISQDDVRYLKEGLPVEIASAGGKQASVRICQFSPTICEETRMAKAIAVMENPSEKWRPGQYINASIRTKAMTLPLVVPKEAVQKIKGEDYLFVQCDESFEPCRVKVGKRDDSHVEILSGIKTGDSYVSTNAFCLKADYEKEECEHSH